MLLSLHVLLLLLLSSLFAFLLVNESYDLLFCCDLICDRKSTFIILAILITLGAVLKLYKYTRQEVSDTIATTQRNAAARIRRQKKRESNTAYDGEQQNENS